SDVCSSDLASFYAVFHGPLGLKAIAQRIHRKAVRVARVLEAAGYDVQPKAFFDTITVDVGALQPVILKAARRERINLRKVGATKIGISLDETTRKIGRAHV